jgi:hypothetical protein
LGFEKKADFSGEIWQKSQKIAIITSTPGRNKAKLNDEQYFGDSSLE